MTAPKLFLLAGTALFAFTSSTVFGECESFTDRLGNTSIKCSDGTTGHLYTDQYGNTAGEIGGSPVRAYRDSYGNTTGRFGDRKVIMYSDQVGNITGRIGDLAVDARRDSAGNITGTVGDSPLKCYRDGSGSTTCHGRELILPIR